MGTAEVQSLGRDQVPYPLNHTPNQTKIMQHTTGAKCMECGHEYQVAVDGPFKDCPECGHDIHKIYGRTFRTREKDPEGSVDEQVKEDLSNLSIFD